MSDANSQKDIWLVIDSRIAKTPYLSNESRFTYGLINALTQKIEIEASRNNDFKIKILLISNDAPPQWMIELITKHPNSASFWCGGPNIFQKKTGQSSWLWATHVFKDIQKITENRFIWLSPTSLDRPLFISKKPIAKKIIQIIQNPIPLLNIPGLSFLFKMQFKFILRRNINNLDNLITTSSFTHETLSKINKKKSSRILILKDFVDQKFGLSEKTNNTQELYEKRKELLLNLISNNEFSKITETQQTLFESILNDFWCIGIGKNKKYKNWDIAQNAVLKLTGKEYVDLDTWFIRLGTDQKEIYSYSKKDSSIDIGPIKIFPKLKTVLIPFLTDGQLASLYSCSDINLCPSIGESYGLSSLEAAFSGTPTIYKSGTVIDDHFEESALPTNYWCRVDSLSPSVWANQIERILNDKKDSSFYKDLYKSNSARQYITNYTKVNNDSWNEQSEKFFDFLFRKNQFQEYPKIFNN